MALALALALGHLGVVLGVAGPQPVPVMVAVLGTQTLGTLTAYAKLSKLKTFLAISILTT